MIKYAEDIVRKVAKGLIPPSVFLALPGLWWKEVYP